MRSSSIIFFNQTGHKEPNFPHKFQILSITYSFLKKEREWRSYQQCGFSSENRRIKASTIPIDMTSNKLQKPQHKLKSQKQNSKVPQPSWIHHLFLPSPLLPPPQPPWQPLALSVPISPTRTPSSPPPAPAMLTLMMTTTLYRKSLVPSCASCVATVATSFPARTTNPSAMSPARPASLSLTATPLFSPSAPVSPALLSMAGPSR